MKLRIILVEPQDAGNVGATARAMKNFGYTDLWIVGGKQRLDDVSTWWAAGATDVVEGASRVDTLGEALADCHMSVATTAVRARQVFEQLTPEEVSQVAMENLGEEHRLALVFGRERSGLTGAEVALCQRTAAIPTWPEFPTMNLAQSVVVFCYELGKGLRPSPAPREPAPHQLTRELVSQTRALLTDIDYFGDKNPDRICAELQALTGRAGLSMREASLLLSLVRKVSGRIG